MELEEALSRWEKNIEKLEQKLAEILKLLPDSYFYTGYEDEQDSTYERYYMDLTGHKLNPLFLGLISKEMHKKEEIDLHLADHPDLSELDQAVLHLYKQAMNIENMIGNYRHLLEELEEKQKEQSAYDDYLIEYSAELSTIKKNILDNLDDATFNDMSSWCQ